MNHALPIFPLSAARAHFIPPNTFTPTMQRLAKIRLKVKQKTRKAYEMRPILCNLIEECRISRKENCQAGY